jgi:type II secretory pathway component GspD/PulD (secretin)
MTLTRITLLAFALSPLALAAQTAPSAEPPAGTTDCSKVATHTLQADCAAKYSQTRIVYLSNVSQQNDANEILVAVRNMFDPSIKIMLLAGQNAVVVSTYPEQLNKIEALIHALDKPRKTYRLTYTIAESDAGKRVGIEHFSIVAVDGQRTTLKQGDKVPVATGSFSTENSASQTQFTYLDVGMNFDATVTTYGSGIMLKSKVEQSSVGASNTIAGVQEPVVRQTVTEGLAAITLGKPFLLGSIDIPGSTRHLDVEIMAELIP